MKTWNAIRMHHQWTNPKRKYLGNIGGKNTLFAESVVGELAKGAFDGLKVLIFTIEVLQAISLNLVP